MSAQATTKRRLYRKSETGRQTRSFTCQFTNQGNTAKISDFFRHGPTSLPNGRGTESMGTTPETLVARTNTEGQTHDPI